MTLKVPIQLLCFRLLCFVTIIDAKALLSVRGARAQQTDDHDVCKLSTTPFTSKVAITLRGSTTETYDNLLSIFLVSFNSSNKKACDVSHRRIVSVQFDSIQQRAGSEVTLIVAVDGMYCSDCVDVVENTDEEATDGIPLFGQLPGVRRLNEGREQSRSLKAFSTSKGAKDMKLKKNESKQDMSKSKAKIKKSNKSKASATSSPSTLPSVSSSSPTSVSPSTTPSIMPSIDSCSCTTPDHRGHFDFEASYQTALKIQMSTIQVLSIHEVAQVACDDIVEYFEKTILVDYTSKRGSTVLSEEENILASNFVNSYNDLSAALCDNLFRSIQNITVSVENTRVLQKGVHGRELQNFVLVGKVKVKGSCRGLGCSLTISGSGSSADRKSVV